MGRAVVGLLATIAACAVPIDIKGEDHGVYFPDLHVSKRLHDKLSIDVGATVGSGDGSQQVGPGEVILFADQTFGPGTVRSDFDLWLFSATVRPEWKTSGEVHVEGIFGLGVQYLDLTLTSGTQVGQDTTTSVGPLAGGRFTWQPAERFGLYAQPYFVLGLREGEFTTLAAVDLGARFCPARHGEIFAGWRYWDYEEERAFSDTNLVLSGPFFGLAFDF